MCMSKKRFTTVWKTLYASDTSYLIETTIAYQNVFLFAIALVHLKINLDLPEKLTCIILKR